MHGGAEKDSEFAIAGEVVPPGEVRTVSIPVSELAAGMQASLSLMVVNGARPGPTVFVSAAIHGDEIVGTAIVQRLCGRLDAASLCGTVILAPAVNIFGFIQHSRYLPDRRDLNRSFPGSENGSLAAQLAHCFLEHVIAPCQLGIDIHSAAVNRYNLPQIRIAAGNPYLVELAMAFGAPVIIEAPLRPGSMRELAQRREVEMLLMETGEALRFDRLSIETGVSGVCRVLAHLGMIPGDDGLSHVGIPARSNRTHWVRAPRGGVSQRARKSGDIVRRGDLLARVGGLFGEAAEDLCSPTDGMIIGHATLPVVNQGDALFHIAQVTNLDHAGQQVGSITEAIDASEPPFAPTLQLDEDEVI